MCDVLSEPDLRMACPRNKDSIRRDTYLLRAKLGMSDTPYFPILHFIEHVLPQIDPTFILEVVDDGSLSRIQAEYIPQANTIRVKRSVYDAAVDGHWLARATMAHELGHYYYHDEKNVRYAKLVPGQRIPPDYDPERQANVFAAELLAPINLISGMSKEQVGKEFGVSYTVARRQLLALDKIRNRQRKKKQQKKKAAKQKPDR